MAGTVDKDGRLSALMVDVVVGSVVRLLGRNPGDKQSPIGKCRYMT